MSFAALITLTVLEIVTLVVVLAIFLMMLTTRLHSISRSLSKVAWGVRAVETEIGNVGPAVIQVNGVLRDLTENTLPGVAAKAQRIANN